MLETHSQAGGERRLVVGDLSEVAAKTQLVRAPQNVQTCVSGSRSERSRLYCRTMFNVEDRELTVQVAVIRFPETGPSVKWKLPHESKVTLPCSSALPPEKGMIKVPDVSVGTYEMYCAV